MRRHGRMWIRRFVGLFLLLLPLQVAALDVIAPFHGGRKSYQQQMAAFSAMGFSNLTAPLGFAQPSTLCTITPDCNMTGQIAMIVRGKCDFLVKMENAIKCGAVAAVVGDIQSVCINKDEILFRMSSELKPNRTIPAVSINSCDFWTIVNAVIANNGTYLGVLDPGDSDYQTNALSSLRVASLILLALPGLWITVILAIYLRRSWLAYSNRVARTRSVQRLPEVVYKKRAENERRRGDCVLNETCAICLEDFPEGSRVKLLPCSHGFHVACINPWINERSDLCPICKASIIRRATRGRVCCEWMCVCCRPREAPAPPQQQPLAAE